MAKAEPIAGLAEDLKKRLASGGVTEATSWIESLGEPEKVCEIYDQAVRDLYWLDRGAESLKFIGPAGIQSCLAKAKQAKDPATAQNLLAQTKTIAYNVAANSWPGWGDEGVMITPDAITIGLEAAHLNLRLALELQKGPDKMAAAFWLLSALQLAKRQLNESLISIDEALKDIQKADDAITETYYKGFKALIQQALGQDTAKDFEMALVKLKAAGTEEALFFEAQLKTTKSIFLK